MPCKPIPVLRLAVASLLQTRQLLAVYEDNCFCSAYARPLGLMSYILFILNHDGRPLGIHDCRCPRHDADVLISSHGRQLFFSVQLIGR